MPKRALLSYKQVLSPIKERVTKFGGQPNWVTEPEWPIDKTNGKKMYFLCQIELTEELFGKVEGKMAYIFMGSDDDADDTWDPEMGRNAVIVQPGVNKQTTVCDPTGPASPLNEHHEEKFNIGGLAEFEVVLDFEDEPPYLNEKEISDLIDSNEGAFDQYAEKMEVNKIGGNPFFIQGEEIPIESWKFLCQIDDSRIPIVSNFGCGIAYAFINSEGTYGKILWQC